MREQMDVDLQKIANDGVYGSTFIIARTSTSRARYQELPSSHITKFAGRLDP